MSNRKYYILTLILLLVSSIFGVSSLAFEAELGEFFVFSLLQDFNLGDNLFKKDSATYKPWLYRGKERPKAKSHRKKLDNTVNSTTKLDSTGGYLFRRDLFNGEQINDPQYYSLDSYLKLRKDKIQLSTWDSISSSYDIKKSLSRTSLSNLLNSAGGLEIPLPQSPLMGIFGKPEININVNGEVNLRAGWRFDSQNLGTVSAFGQSQSTPIFSQDVRVNVSGGIGDKVRLSTDWNTRTTMNRDNRFKIGFDGYDDDIIKKVEFGNVSLPLTSSLISGGQALFGVRADFQFGPLFLKTLLSQRRGERRFVDARGGSSKQYFQIRAYDFAKNHFFLDTVYKPIYKSYFKSGSGIIPIEANKHRIKYIEVYESQNQIVVQDAVINAKAFADLPDIGYGEKYSPALRGAAVVAGEVEAGRFQKLDTTKYKFDRNLGTITILNLKQDRTYAVAYRTEGLSTVENDDRYFGTNSLDAKLQDTLILKLVSRMNFQPGFKTLWSRQMRNIYQVNAQNINANDTKIGLWYFRQSNDSADVIQGAPDKIVTILGVDQRDLAGQAKPDGQFDLSNSPFFNLERGEIVFPTLEPFREGLIDYFTRIGNPAGAEPYIYPEIYDTTEVTAKRNTARDRFVISGEVSGRAVGRINLNAFNLAPGSVRVSLDGVTLKEYSDYIVDYTSGNVTIKNDRANLPNANLRVEYEQQNVIDVATKTQAGLRADYRLFQNRTSNADIGMTLMHYNQATLVDRVQLGQEPVANTMLGFDLKYTTDAPIVTKALDLLPFFDTKAPSSFNIGGEWAIMLPTPNRRTSTIASDLGSPVVFLDDFEAAMRTIAIGMNPTQWSHSSAPLDDKISINDAERGLYRGKFFWYKRFIPYVPSIEVYPEKEVLTGNARISPLEIDFSPDFRGIYNRNPQFLDTLNPDYVNQSPKWAKLPENRSKIWGGMQRLLSTFNTNFDNENVEFLEVVMKIDEWEPTTKFYIDLGQISEDVIGNGTLDTEDGSTDASRIPNGRIDPGEDNGIDTLNNEREKATYPAPLNLEADPARDDYFFDFTKNDEIRTRNDWDKYNNFEGNGTQSELGQFPDKEILNENNGQTISLDNSYFRYEVIVDPDPNKNTQIVGGANGWYMYRLPIRRPKEKVGNPLFSNIQYARLIVQGGNIKARIVDWRLVGSQWQRFHNFQSNLSPFDSTLSLAFVNLFENSREPDFYSLPPGVQAPIQPNVDPNRTLRLNEQSLSLSVKNLRFGDERMAIRVLPRFDLFYYKKMKFFIHGDGSMPSFIDRNSTPKAFAYFRFGTDSSNYYEYKKPLLRGWQDIEIDLNEITAIKQIRDTSRFIDRQVFPTKNDPLATFAVRGEPILTKVQFIGVGIANPSERFPNELSTTMWINELRLIEPEQRADWAAVGSADLKLADLGSINASMNMTQPNFHRLEERFGNRTSQGNFTVTVNGNLEKFAPASFTGMKLPITYTHAEFTTNPEFVANNDVNLEQAAIAARNSLPATATEEERIAAANNVLTRSQTLKVQDSWALTSVKLGIPVKYWLVDDIFNKMTFGYSYSQEFERSPIFQERFNWLWKFNSQYQNTIPEFLAIEPLLWAKDVPILKTYQKWKFNILPTNINFGLDLSRRRQTEQSRFLELPSPIIRDFTANRSAQLNWKLSNGGFLNPVIDYTVRNTSTLLPYEFAEDGSQRTGSEIIKNMFANDGEFLKFGNSTMHTQNVSIIMKPVIPDIYGLNKHLDMTSSFNTDYNWNDPLQPDPTIRDRAKNVNFNNRLRFSIGLGLMALTDEWFGVFKPSPFMAGPRKDSTSSIWSDIGSALKTIFFDFRKIDIVFDQTNTSTNPSVFGGTGMNNFWGRGLTFRESQDIYGPSMAYQLGLVEHPHGGINLVRSTAFPFFGFQTTPGLRPANTIAQDNFTQKTNFTITTSRQLWEGFTLDLNWKTNLGFNKNQTVITEANGVPQFSNIQALESFNRTFISLPSLFGVNVFGNRLENVARSFEQRRIQIEATETDSVIKNRRLQDAIAQSFYNELEAFSFTGGRIGRFLPSMNWGIRWEGLEKIPLWSSVVRKIEVRHAYTSTYDESVLINDQGRAIQNQTIATGFSPLVEVNMTFDEKKLDGRLTATLRWNNTNNFNVNAASRSAINSQTTNEINANATYNMRGFKMDFLGIDLQNDLEMSFLFTYKSNSSESLNILSPTASQDNAQGQQIRGDTQIIVEPRARYSLSNRVTATAFFRYESQASQGAGSPGFSTTQFGVDVRISISGGR